MMDELAFQTDLIDRLIFAGSGIAALLRVMRPRDVLESEEVAIALQQWERALVRHAAHDTERSNETSR
jgi:hypothetical protein